MRQPQVLAISTNTLRFQTSTLFTQYHLGSLWTRHSRIKWLRTIPLHHTLVPVRTLSFLDTGHGYLLRHPTGPTPSVSLHRTLIPALAFSCLEIVVERLLRQLPPTTPPSTPSRTLAAVLEISLLKTGIWTFMRQPPIPTTLLILRHSHLTNLIAKHQIGALPAFPSSNRAAFNEPMYTRTSTSSLRHSVSPKHSPREGPPPHDSGYAEVFDVEGNGW